MKSISDKYYNMFTPAGYAFSIWGIIYFLLIVHTIYSIYELNKKNNSSVTYSLGYSFLIANVVNGLWVYFWLSDAIFICLILMVVLLVLLMNIFLKIKKSQIKESFKSIIFSSPFDLYAGWISVALIANTAVWLTKINWEPIIFTEAGWTIFLLTIAGIIGMFISWNYNAIAFGFSVAWGLTAVAVNNFDQNFNIVITAVIVSISILSVCLYQLIHKIIPSD